MSVRQETVRLGFASANPKKIALFAEGLPEGQGVSIPPLFIEDSIKDRLSASELDGFAYVNAISREKLSEQRRRLQEEGISGEYALLVSDSVLMLENDDGSFEAINRDGNTPEKSREISERIMSKREIVYAGSVSFGRKDGTSVFTVTTYLRVPIGDSPISFPLNNDDIPTLKDPDKDYEAGYVSYRYNSGNPQSAIFNPVERSSDFSRVRPFISGLTAEVKQFAQDTALADRETAPIVRDIISKRPFNTMSFYNPEHRSLNLEDFYQEIVQRNSEYFNRYGGNCSFFTLELTRRFNELGIPAKIGLYPGLFYEDDRRGIPSGHSAVFVKYNNRDYFFDPGITVPFAVPVGGLPIAPFIAGDKFILVGVEGDKSVPDMLILRKSGRVSRHHGERMVDEEEFRRILPETLVTLHNRRRAFKLDFHTPDGIKSIGFTYVIKGEILKIRTAHADFEFALSDLIKDKNKLGLVERLCNSSGVDGRFVLSQLINLSQGLAENE